MLRSPSFNHLLFFTFGALSFFQILGHLEDPILSVFDVVNMTTQLLFIGHIEFFLILIVSKKIYYKIS